jgi:hypothetical protein
MKALTPMHLRHFRPLTPEQLHARARHLADQHYAKWLEACRTR